MRTSELLLKQLSLMTELQADNYRATKAIYYGKQNHEIEWDFFQFKKSADALELLELGIRIAKKVDKLIDEKGNIELIKKYNNDAILIQKWIKNFELLLTENDYLRMSLHGVIHNSISIKADNLCLKKELETLKKINDENKGL